MGAIQVLKSILLVIALYPVVGHADELKEVVEKRLLAYINDNFSFVEVDGKPHAFNGKVKDGAISRGRSSGTIFEYQNIEYTYRALPISRADVANDILWRGELTVFGSPFRKIYYSNGISILGGVEIGNAEAPCWENWKDMERQMALKWQFVLKKNGWHPTVFRIDHPRWIGGPPITRDGAPSRELVAGLLKYGRCGY
ncbi:hypothetical protein ACLIKD_06920 [Azonexus sp. IMCC34842]|uniref:hypothetical protein n=1 Tax=Azonexus sp. IMCC34842 TaxID=3420950 RepID=UPI003D1186B3